MAQGSAVREGDPSSAIADHGWFARWWQGLAARPRRTLLWLLVVATLLRVPFWWTPFESDEGGFLMVARQWHGPGVGVYTDQWVDRPPVLLVVFKLGVWLGGERVVVRVLALVCGLVTIVAAYSAGRVINGSTGAVVAAWVATFATSSFAFHGFALTGEAIAGAFVMSSCALLLTAVYGDADVKRRVWITVAAGALAVLAFLSKQNFLDAAVFAFALLVVRARRTWQLMIAFAAGAAVPLLATLAWALSSEGPGLNKLYVALFRFRQRSLTVIEDASLDAPLERLRWLLLLFVASGLAFLAWQTIAAAVRSDGRKSLRFALVAMLVYVGFSIAAGASWWTHYLLQLAAVLAMGTALASRRPRPAWRMFGPATYVAVAAIYASAHGMVAMAQGHIPAQQDHKVAEYLRAASEPGDSVVLAYGSPAVIEESGLSTPYRYAWSLPIRTRDPHLTVLVETLDGPDAPTWLVEIGDFDWWDLDNTAFETARAEHYTKVAEVCGHAVYLRADEQRDLPAPPDSC